MQPTENRLRIPEGPLLEKLVDDLLRTETGKHGAYAQEIESAIEDVVYVSYGISEEERSQIKGRLSSAH